MHLSPSVQILKAQQRLPTHIRDLLLGERPDDLVNVLQADCAQLHANPEPVPPQVRSIIAKIDRLHNEIFCSLDVVPGQISHLIMFLCWHERSIVISCSICWKSSPDSILMTLIAASSPDWMFLP